MYMYTFFIFHSIDGSHIIDDIVNEILLNTSFILKCLIRDWILKIYWLIDHDDVLVLLAEALLILTILDLLLDRFGIGGKSNKMKGISLLVPGNQTRQVAYTR